MKVAGIVLCGGGSNRMGYSKAQLPFGPELMLERVLRLLHEIVEPLVVVSGPHQPPPALPPGVLLARDRKQGRGPLEGLFAGLTALEGKAEAAYATSCDVPLLVPDFVRQMIGMLGEHQVAVPVEGKLHHPLAAVYRLEVASKIADLLDADRLRPIFLYEKVATRRVPVELLRGVDPRLETLSNLNRPEDYLAALAQAGFSAPPDLLARLRHDAE